MTSRRELRMRDVMVEFHDGPHATPPPADDGPVFLGIRNITEGGRLDLTEIRHIAEADYLRWTRRVVPQADDIVFSYEATLHRYAIVPPGFRGCLGRRLALIRPDRSVVEPRFLHFLLLGPEWRETVIERTIAGSTVDRIPLIDFPDFPVSVPGLDYQREIVHFLGAIDDLIEHNRRRIELLEQMAQAIYREWFIDLCYPGHEDDGLVNSPDGSIPSGWHWERLDAVCTAESASVDPSSIDEATPAVGLEHLGRRTFTLASWGKAGALTSRKLLFRRSDVLFGKIRPYFHKVALAPVDGICSTDAIILRARGPRTAFVLLTAFSDEFVAHAVTTSNGTKMPRADWRVLRGWRIPKPPDEVARLFEDTLAPILELSVVLMAQSRVLAAARDLLLPRMVTGEIDVSTLVLDELVDEATG